MNDEYDKLKSEGNESALEAAAIAASAPALAATALMGPQRRATKLLAKAGMLESRSRLAWTLARNLDAKIPELKVVTNRLDELIHAMHDAEGQHLDYDNKGIARRELDEIYGYFPDEWNAKLNEALEGGAVDVDALPEIPGKSKQDFIDVYNSIKDGMRAQGVEFNKQERRIKAGPGDHNVVEQGFHKQNLSTARPGISNLRNIWNAVLGSHAGISERNRGNIEAAVSNYIKSNSSFVDGKVQWKSGRERGWWRGDENRGVSSSDGGDRLNPDNITTPEQYQQWIDNEPNRLTTEVMDYKSKLDDGVMNDGERQRFDRIMPYLGATVHNIHVLDVFRALEAGARNIEAMKRMPDNYFEKVAQVRKDLLRVAENLKEQANINGGDASYADLARDALDLVDMIGETPARGNLLGDMKEVIGSAPVSNGSQWLSRVLNATAAPVIGNALKYNFESGARQEGQVLMASLAAHPTRILGHMAERLKASPLAKFIAPSSALRTQSDIHTYPSRWKLNPLTELMSLSKGTSQNQAAVISNATNHFKKDWFTDGPHQEYFDRLFSLETKGEITKAIESGDDNALFEKIRPMLVRELDMTNGSGLSTSRPAAFKGGPVREEFARLIATPFSVTSSILGGKDRYGAASIGIRDGGKADFIRGASKFGAATALGSQLFLNAAITASPAIKAATAVGLGSYAPALYYAIRAANNKESNTETSARGKSQTMMSMLKSGDPRIALAMAYESMPLKLNSSGDLITGSRGSIDKSLGWSTAAKKGMDVLDVMSTISPTANAIKMLTDVGSAVASGKGMSLLSEGSPLPVLRQFVPPIYPMSINYTGSDNNPITTESFNQMAPIKKAMEVKIKTGM